MNALLATLIVGGGLVALFGGIAHGDALLATDQARSINRGRFFPMLPAQSAKAL